MAQFGKTPFKARWLQGGLFAGIILVTLTLMLPIWLEVISKLDQLRTANRDNVIWTITQLEVEFLELEKAALRLELDGASGARNVSRRFNVLYSRLGTLHKSSLYRGAIAEAGEADNLDILTHGIEALLPMVDGPAETLASESLQLQAKLQMLRAVTRRIVGNGNFVLNTRSEAAREEVAQLVGRLGIASVILFGGLFGLATLFSRLYVVYKSRARENLLNSRRLATVVRTSPDGIIVVDADGMIQDFNLAAEDLLVRTRAEVMKTPVSELIKDASEHPVELPAKRMNFFRQRMIGVSSLGRPIPLEVSQGATSLGDQRVFVYFLRDISERLAAEEALKASRDRALEGERAKARFLAVMSHEMRTPLSGILGVIELMRASATPGKDHHYLSLLEQSGHVLLEHVNEVLDITEIEARGVKLNPDIFHMDALLSEVVAALHAPAKARGNDLRMSTSPQQLGYFKGDAMRVRQIVANLLSNAVKFTENGQIELMVSAYPTRDGTEIEFQISDTGIGIEQSKLAEVFDDFVRLGRGRHSQVRGTGLGLGIVRRIVTAMGGQIGVDSIHGEGSMFWVKLVLPAVSLVDPKSLQDGLDTGAATVPVRKMDILLVEDNATNRFVLRELLELDGHTIVEVSNGQIGVDIAKQRFFDVILMDINMPVMGGIEATQLIRAGGACKDTRIVALTAHVLAQDKPLYHEVGIDQLVGKPISRRNIQRVLMGGALSQETTHSNVTLDLVVLEQLSQGLNSDRTGEIIQSMLSEGDSFIKTLDQADLLSNNELVDAVHAFSGGCAMIGAVRLRNTLTNLEDVLRRRPHTDPVLWFEPLRVLWKETRAELERYAATNLSGANRRTGANPLP